MVWGVVVALECDGIVLREDGDEWCCGVCAGWVVRLVYGFGESVLSFPCCYPFPFLLIRRLLTRAPNQQMAYDTPYHTAGAGMPGAPGVPGIPGSAAAGKPFTSLPLRQQVAHGFKDMGARSWSTAKNFGAVGALFSGIECGIEGLRAKNDLGNGVAAGCLTGAILARNGGPQASAVGCAGFAAFSAAIDAWMRMPKDED